MGLLGLYHLKVRSLLYGWTSALCRFSERLRVNPPSLNLLTVTVIANRKRVTLPLIQESSVAIPSSNHLCIYTDTELDLRYQEDIYKVTRLKHASQTSRPPYLIPIVHASSKLLAPDLCLHNPWVRRRNVQL